ncbi:formate/nitrite transporter family protein [Staphylococcus sp. EZ-P03]|uniref:formate/nitrite transporter family protein n=1 Tax=Staphylococcus sp. EZ-P03 TaxID=2282739 RepID=UPI000DF7FD6C|nr:formate/nitrite transporter family protein [Staphylococcus sp. EZ-P03]
MGMKNLKTLEDTYASRQTMDAVVGSSQMKAVMLEKTPVRYFFKSMMSGFLLSIVAVFMLAMKTQHTGLNEGTINFIGAVSFSLALVLIVLTQSELLTSNFMYMTAGAYYKSVPIGKIIWLFIFCFIGNIAGGFVLFGLMKFTHVMTPEMIKALTGIVEKKTTLGTWEGILVKGIFANFFINIGIYVSMQFKDGLSKTFFVACGVVVFVFMGYEHVVYNANLFSGMMFYNIGALAWLDVLKNIVFAFIGNYIGGGIFIGLLFAFFNGKRNRYIEEQK